jgi:hypothetical protein
MGSREHDGVDAGILVSPVDESAELSRHAWIQQRMLAAINPDNQGRAVFFYFQSCFVFGRHDLSLRSCEYP